MSTFFNGTGNIGGDAEFRVFPQGNEEPRKLLRLNVRFDNPVPVKDGYQDRGGFWAPVEIWHLDAEQWCKLYRKGMRVLVQGRIICQEWEDKKTGDKRITFKVEAREIGILPHRISEIILEHREGEQQELPPMENSD